MFKSVLAVLLFSALASAGIHKITDVVVKDLDGNDVSFAKFAGKCVLVVNTASGCSLTKANMEYLNKLSDRHPDLVIVAFPSDHFGHEKKSNPELKAWFKDEWKVKYHYFAPVCVKGADVYKWLIKQSGKEVEYNYGKYVVEKDGVTVTLYNHEAGAVVAPHPLDDHLKKCVA